MEIRFTPSGWHRVIFWSGLLNARSSCFCNLTGGPRVNRPIRGCSRFRFLSEPIDGHIAYRVRRVLNVLLFQLQCPVSLCFSIIFASHLPASNVTCAFSKKKKKKNKRHSASEGLTTRVVRSPCRVCAAVLSELCFVSTCVSVSVSMRSCSFNPCYAIQRFQ